MIIQEENRHVREREQGFTLVEVMIAIGVLAFGILAIASMQTSSLGGTSRANSLTEATTFAMDRMERVMILPYSQVLLQNENVFSSADGVYNATINVNPGTPTNNAATVTVTVNWQEKGVNRVPLVLTNIKNQL